MYSRKLRKKLSLVLVFVLFVSLFAFTAPIEPKAASNFNVSGYVNSASGAVLRSKASTSGKKLAVLKKGSPLVIHKEVFTTKKKTSAKKKWYHVTSGAGSGYIRSDLVGIKIYASANGKAKKKIKYRAGAGNSMKKKGTFKKNSSFVIVMQAKAKGSGATWYKVKKGSKYYYVKNSSLKVGSIRSGVPDIADPAVNTVQSPEALRVVNGACAWAQMIADDNRFHYGKKPNSQHNGCYFCGTQKLTGGRSKAGVLDYQFSYCCNPYVHAAYAHGGGEQTMLEVCKSGSSYWITGYPKSPLFVKLGVPNMALLKKGDVLCTNNHVMMYMGGGKIAEATGGDDNVRYSSSWNNSIRVTTLSASKYAKVLGAYRYVGNVN